MLEAPLYFTSCVYLMLVAKYYFTNYVYLMLVAKYYFTNYVYLILDILRNPLYTGDGGKRGINQYFRFVDSQTE